MTERWRELLDDPERGQWLRALCRLATSTNIWFKIYTFDGVRDAVIRDLQSEEYGSAAVMISYLAWLLENDRRMPGPPVPSEEELTEDEKHQARRFVISQALAWLAGTYDSNPAETDEAALRARVIADMQADDLASAAHHLGMLARIRQVRDLERRMAEESE